MTKKARFRPTGNLAIALAVAGALVLGGCPKEESKESREQEQRIAAEQARQQLLAAEYVADLAAETEVPVEILNAEAWSRICVRHLQSSHDIGKLARLIPSPGASKTDEGDDDAR